MTVVSKLISIFAINVTFNLRHQSRFHSAMLCASCQCRLPPSDALPTSMQTQELREFLRSHSILADPARYESEIASSTTALMHYDSEIQRLEGSIRALMADRQRLQVRCK